MNNWATKEQCTPLEDFRDQQASLLKNTGRPSGPFFMTRAFADKFKANTGMDLTKEGFEVYPKTAGGGKNGT